ncbi:lymphocyte antigen 75-like isoform X1 [Lates japonicus]
MNQLINTVSSAGYNSDVWVGLYSKVEWKWSDGYTGSGAEFRSWETSDDEPDFVSANQFCVNIGGGGGWWDDDCSLKYPFICYRGTQLDPEFVLVNETMDWSSARRHCRENFIDLATVRNHTENTEIQNLVPSGNWAWTGLSRDPNFYWSDQSNFSFSNLDNTANLIGSMRIICGVAALHRSGKWRFLPCERRLPFVCHSIPPPSVKRQVVKLRMKVENSVDLNDPAVKAGILKKLQDRLEENGVSGVSLKWREQPDGKVFHKEGEKSSGEKKGEDKKLLFHLNHPLQTNSFCQQLHYTSL